MPACRPSQLRASISTSGPIHDNVHSHALPKLLTNYARRRTRRYAATAAALAPKPTVADLETSFHFPIRTLLHKTTSFLPRVLPNRGEPSAPNTAEFWQDVLRGTYDRLNGAEAEAPARLVVYGCDEHSGARDLVTALLEEPFALDIRKSAIQQRWREAGQDTERVITFGYSSSDIPTSLRTPSNWLRQFPVPTEIRELPITRLNEGTSSAAYKALFSADIPIIVCNPVTTPLSTLHSHLSLALQHGKAILVVVASGELAPSCAEYVAKQFPPSLSVVFVDPSRALNATRTLSAEPGSSIAVQRYQDNFTSSGISQLTSVLVEKLSVTSSGGINALYALTAREQIKACLSSCQAALKAATREADAVDCARYSLLDDISELEARIGGEVLGANSGSEVKKALSRAKQEVETVMDRLTWWRCVWRVDDIGDTVKGAVDKAWCRELESRLIFHSGRLAVSQDSLAKSTRSLLSSYKPLSPFHSPVLENQLSQLQAAPSYAVTSGVLTTPVHARRIQLSYPTNTLHSTAQRVTIGMGTSVLAGLGTAWAGWAEKLGVLGGALTTGLEMETAIGTGMLMGTAGVWWMVGRWEKAKRRWWRDWDRIGEGLERDLQTTLLKTVRDKVAVVPTQASEGLGHISAARRDEIEALKEELSSLEEETYHLDSKSTP